MQEPIYYINCNQSSVYVLMLDTSKAFDKENYCKLFRQFLRRDELLFILRLLLPMNTNQTLRVRWVHTLSNIFGGSNGVKQGVVLSPILFAVYTDDLLMRSQETGVGCHIPLYRCLW